ncbi:MAG TPA: phosphate ABC transporter substrate-binding protein PstS [Candidatus Sulfotelmatobacter sp.]|nr:phosphate ABC transporter substrate-binding protein PstS [Candidatus Sulfotelmatobacter sp.]
MRFDPWRAYLLRRFVGIVASMIVASASLQNRLEAQTAENLTGVKRVAVEWSGTDRSSAATRNRVMQKLKASGAVELVPDAGKADGILHGSVTVWLSGYVSTSPRSKGAEQAVYRGFASAVVTGKDGRTLWSYLVTPRTVGWKNITDDLADQLAHALLSALAKKDVDERIPVAGNAAGAGPGSTRVIALQGAGATFPAPIYQKWFETFTRGRPDVQIQYAAVGSGEGIRRLLAGQVDFGASDMPLSEEQLNAPGKKVLQMATLLGAVVPIYNVKGTPQGLNFTGEVLAGIFLGKIQRWNAPEIQAINKRVHLPDEAIVLIHRSDGSGTTFAWTDYLSKVSAEWESDVGAGTMVKWPTGSGAEHNDGVAEAVHKTPNSIGYVEFIYALQHELEYAAVRNAAGEYVKADLDSVTAAAKTAVIPKSGGFGASITNATGKHTYPIATFTWLLVPVDEPDAAKKGAVRDLLRWMLTAGQKQCEGLGYAPLPPEFANRELQALAGLN